MIKINTKIILQKIRRHILQRTASGKDTYDNAFKPYKPAYAKKKKSSKVNLRYTGHMLNDLKVLDDETMGLSDSFAITKAIGNANHGRQFMGNITNAQQKIIQKQVAKQTQQQVRRMVKNWKIK